MTRIRGERGLSLVEVTIILSVLMVLVATIAPSMSDFTNDARQTVAKQEVEVIGNAIQRMLGDTGSRCLRLVGTSDCTVTNRVDLLVTSGPDPIAIDTALAPDITVEAPIREWGLSREASIAWANERDIPIPVKASSPYSSRAS